MAVARAETLRDVPLCVPDVRDEDVARVEEVLRSGWLTHGPYNAQFESEFARYMGVAHAVGVNSCASALHLTLLGLGITGEVILPSFTFVASANAVVTAGAVPVFVEVDYETCTLDPDALEAAITARTEAVMPVHYAGHPCDMARIVEIAGRHGLAVVEDSAEAIGAEYYGRKTGTFGVGCFSFYPTKNMTTGEGGMVVSDDGALAARVRAYAGHGISSGTLARERAERPWLRAASVPGYNFRLSNIHAALGIGQLERLDEMNSRRREHAARYGEGLRDLDELELPAQADDCLHVYQMYTVKLNGVARTEFLAALRRRRIGASVHFDPPVHTQPYYVDRSASPPSLPITEEVAAKVVTLPLYPSMTEGQLQYVVDGVWAALAEGARA